METGAELSTGESRKQQQAAETDHSSGISSHPISTDLSKPGLISNDPTATHLPQLHHVLLIDVTATATETCSSCRDEVEESDDGFRTPTNIIPPTTECPPAPRKPKSQKRSTSTVLGEESESRGNDHAVDIDMVMEVNAWLDSVEEEDRKRIKKSRRQAL